MISSISLQGFTTFTNHTLSFSSGLNVFIGKNGTGKTHLLKAIASSLAACNEFESKKLCDCKERCEFLLAESICRYFKTEFVGNLVSKSAAKTGNASVLLLADGCELSYSFDASSQSSVHLGKLDSFKEQDYVYLPSREMLSIFEGFLSLSNKRELAFDESFTKLALSLALPPLRHLEHSPLKAAIDLLKQELGFSVVLKNGRFYAQRGEELLEAHLLSEGECKLASMLYLLGNGEINEDTVLLIDEPEAGLNPSLVKVMAKLLLMLEQCGLQILITSHDFLLTQTISLHSEYRKHTHSKARFYHLFKGKDGIGSEGTRTDGQLNADGLSADRICFDGLAIDEADTLAQIENNSILDEYAAFYDLEQQFFKDFD